MDLFSIWILSRFRLMILTGTVHVTLDTPDYLLILQRLMTILDSSVMVPYKKL